MPTDKLAISDLVLPGSRGALGGAPRAPVATMLPSLSGGRYCIALAGPPHPSRPLRVGIFAVASITVTTAAIAGDPIMLRPGTAKLYFDSLAAALEMRARLREYFDEQRHRAPVTAPRPICAPRHLKPRVRARRRRAQCRLRSPPSADGDGPRRGIDRQPARLPARGAIPRARAGR